MKKNNSVNKSKLEVLKKEVIEILKNQAEKEYKKALNHFLKEEENYSYLTKSISGEWIEKAGYPVGTVREWKGKKYRKIAPGKWARMYEKEGRGTNIAVGHLIAKVKKIDDIEELMSFVMQNKQRFQDENGMDLPILDKIRAEVDRQSGKIESKGKSENTVKKEVESDIERAKDKIKKYAGKKINSNEISDIKILDDGIRSGLLTFEFKSGNNKYRMTYDRGFGGQKGGVSIKKFEKDSLTRDDMKEMAKEVGDINSKEIMEKISKEESIKKYDELYKKYFPIEPKIIKDAKDKWLSKIDNNKITDELVKNAKDQAKKMNDVMLLNKLEEFKNRKPIDINVKNEQHFKHWVLNHISNNSSYRNSVEDAMRDFHIPYDPAAGNTNEKNELALSILEKEAKQRGLIEDNKESKSEKKEEKQQNNFSLDDIKSKKTIKTVEEFEDVIRQLTAEKNQDNAESKFIDFLGYNLEGGMAGSLYDKIFEKYGDTGYSTLKKQVKGQKISEREKNIGYADEYANKEEEKSKKAKIKKSLEDILLLLNEDEEEEDYNDYSAEDPELFNSVAYRVANAFEECGY